jgi:hypothetical protein
MLKIKRFLQRHTFANCEDSCAKRTRSNLHRILIILLLVTFLTIALSFCNNLYADDRDGDGMPDEEEHYIATKFQPKIWADQGEGEGPLWLDGLWCLDGQRPAQHQKGYLGYNVVDLKFSDLLAIEYTLFYDHQSFFCIMYWDEHWFDNEGFSVLVQRCPSCSLDYRLVSVQTCGHHRTSEEIWDRMYPQEVDTLKVLGILAAEDDHANYVHRLICNGHLAFDCENCANYGDGIEINDSCETGLISYQHTCSCDSANLSCLDDSLSNADCWAKRYFYHSGFSIDCDPPDEQKNLYTERKQLPPWIPIEIGLPENLAYADLFEEPGFTAEPVHLDDDELMNFGPGLVDSGMPLRLIDFPHGSWWHELYDPYYYNDSVAHDWFGLERHVFQYTYWTHNGYMDFVDKAGSIKLRGLPGTILALYDLFRGGDMLAVRDSLFLVIPDGARDTAIENLESIGMNDKIDFVSWGFGPLADAGNDTTVQCRERVILDARKSYQYALDPEIAFRVFDLGRLDYDTIFSYDSIWTYEWFDESDDNRLLGTGSLLETSSLQVGSHSIRLTVTGIVVRDPILRATFESHVSDWCTVTVSIGEPVGIISGIVTDPTGGILGVTVTAFNLDSNNVSKPSTFAHACTDEDGFYRFDSLAPGDYEVTIVPPIGFSAVQESKYDSIAYSCWPLPITINFQITPLSITPSQESMGFWKHQVNAHLEGKGKPQVTLAELSNYMGLIRIHFNENCANRVTIFQVPQPATLTDSLRVLRDLLTVNQNGTMNDRAKQQLIALMLNVVSLKLHLTTPISMDSAIVSQAITYCNQLIMDSNPYDDEVAKDIADCINNGMLVGYLPHFRKWVSVIPLTTPHITYKGTEEIAGTQVMPGEFSLSHNYPNPFNPETQISYSLPKDCRVKLTIFNLLGQKVKTLVDEFQTAGAKAILWDGKDDKGQECASGIYFYHLQAGEFSQAKKMVIVK